MRGWVTLQASIVEEPRKLVLRGGCEIDLLANVSVVRSDLFQKAGSLFVDVQGGVVGWCHGRSSVKVRSKPLACLTHWSLRQRRKSIRSDPTFVSGCRW